VPAAPANPPVPLTPGQVESTLPIAPAVQQPKAAPPVTPLSQTPVSVPPGGPTVTLQSFDITGNSIYSTDFLRSLLAAYLNRPLTVEDLYKAADVLTAYYQAHGYSVARATVPQQKLDNGVLELQVIEGQLGKLQVQGNSRTRSGVIEKQSAALKSGEVYTDAAMDRAVLLVNDLPGMHAQAVLAPGTDFGTVDVVYQADEQGYNGSGSVDNYGRRDIGLWRVNAEADVNSLTGSGDRLSASLTHSEGDLLIFGGLSYSLPLGPDGGRLTAGYNESNYSEHPTDPKLAVTEPGGKSKNGSLSYNYAVERGRLESGYLGAGLLHSGTDTILLGKVVTQTNLNTLSLTGSYNHFHEDGGYWSVDGSFATNGKYNDGSGQANTDAERAKLDVDGALVQPLGGSQWSFTAKASGQWSPDPLVDTEKLYFGGPDNARGFPSADVRGDSGLFASGDLQRSFDNSEFALGGFVDAGRAWTAGGFYRQQKSQGKLETAHLAASVTEVADFGAEMIFTSADKRWQARLEWATAFGGHKPSDGNAGGHIWATVGMSF
jgi:hemolysin activation/secretion protein